MKTKPVKLFVAINRGGYIFDASPWRGILLRRVKIIDGIKYGCKIIPVLITPIERKRHAKRKTK